MWTDRARWFTGAVLTSAQHSKGILMGVMDQTNTVLRVPSDTPSATGHFVSCVAAAIMLNGRQEKCGLVHV